MIYFARIIVVDNVMTADMVREGCYRISKFSSAFPPSFLSNPFSYFHYPCDGMAISRLRPLDDEG